MKTYKSHDYEYGDLVVLVFEGYNRLNKGEIGIVGYTYSKVANIHFANVTGAFPYDQFVPLEALCK
jgi:hypothetical protein